MAPPAECLAGVPLTQKGSGDVKLAALASLPRTAVAPLSSHAPIVGSPVHPRPHTRGWVADHLGIAADAVGVATQQYGRVPVEVIGNFLEQACDQLDALVPDLPKAFGRHGEVIGELMGTNAGMRSLAATYFLKGKTPPAGMSAGWLMARYTYNIRHAQDILEGVGD